MVWYVKICNLSHLSANNKEQLNLLSMEHKTILPILLILQLHCPVGSPPATSTDLSLN